MRRFSLVLFAAFATVSACVIGPKQDDPLTGGAPSTEDTGAASDATTALDDSSPEGADTETYDASPPAPCGEVGDAACTDGADASDAVTDAEEDGATDGADDAIAEGG